MTGTTEPKAVALDVTRRIGGWEFVPPLLLALVIGIVFFLIAYAAYRTKWDKRTPGGDAWSFSGSWLTSVSAISTALAGVLAASGFVDELVPGVPLGNFMGLSLTFGGLVIAAPIVFSAFQVVDWKVEGEESKQVAAQVIVGRIAGLVWAATCTCAGVAGLLGMLAVLTLLSNASMSAQAVVLAVLAAIAITVGFYVRASTSTAVEMSTNGVPHKPATATSAIIPPISQVTGFTGAL